MTRQEMIDALTQTECVVEFTKVNGEFRRMPCTLNLDLIPSQFIKEETKQRKVNESIINVWCTDKKDWRSFKVDNVMSFKINDVYV